MGTMKTSSDNVEEKKPTNSCLKIFFKYYFNTFLKKDALLHNLNKMNLLTSMPHSPTYQQVVLGKIKSEKLQRKKNKMKTNSKQSNMKREKK